MAFSNSLSPNWLDTSFVSVTFPSELQEDTSITDIISKNNDDVIGAKFNEKLHQKYNSNLC